VFFVIFVIFAIRELRDFREQGKSPIGAERREYSNIRVRFSVIDARGIYFSSSFSTLCLRFIAVAP